jgi:hypothetical protein
MRRRWWVLRCGMPLSWIVAGSAATSGLLWFLLIALRSASFGWLSIVIAAVVSAFASGALLASHVPVKPTRAPVLAGAIGCGLVFAAQLALTMSTDRRLAYAAPVYIASVCLAAASGAAGAEVTRRFKGVSASAPSVMILSCAVTFGISLTCGPLASSVGVDHSGLGVPMMFGAIAVAGFVTQLVVPIRAPWLSASGIMLLPVFSYVTGTNDESFWLMVLGSLVFVLIGRIGTALANAKFPKPKASDLPARASGR